MAETNNNNNSVELINVSKTYKVYERSSASPLDKILNVLRGSKAKSFNALENINLNIKKGEFFGIIGHNGSGKSTLLNIISKAIPPNKGGTVNLNSSFTKLKVGLGFNQQLTARQNIYLTGSILGLRIKEIDIKLDTILEFAGVTKFKDTPLKYFSSGMRSRLGFSIALYAKSEILLLDEFIGGVGDLDFKAKAEKAFDEMILNGRTIIFVSHSMTMVKKMCSRVLLLHHGEQIKIGHPNEVVELYEKDYKK